VRTKDGTELPECPPFVKSIVRISANPSSATNVAFTVIFSKPVEGVDAADFKLTNTFLTGASITKVSGTDSGPYTVMVNTGTGNGTIRLDLRDTALFKAQMKLLLLVHTQAGKLTRLARELLPRSLS